MSLRLFLDFAIALFIGALVGIDREKKKADAADPSFAGLRTYILLSETGAVAAWLSRQMNNPAVFVVGGACITAMLIAGYIQTVRRHPQATGLTGEVAAVVVYLLGGVVMYGQPGLAVALGIATSGFLAFKQPLHALLGKIDRDDIYAGLKLLIATFIVLPVLPNRAVDPWGALNPYKMWLLVILISGISLVGYIAIRWLGTQHGTPLTGLLGGVASSTAVSLAFARRSRDEREQRGAIDALASGILLAWLVMFIRIVGFVAVVYRPLLPRLLLPMSVMGVACLLMAVVFYFRSSSDTTGSPEPVRLKNPFSLTSAIKFAAVFAAVLVVVKFVRQHGAGAGGLYLTAGLAGLTDVDAITLSMAELARGGGGLTMAATAIALAAVSNTFVKWGFVLALGDRGLKWRMSVATAIMLLAGAGSMFVLWR